MITLSNALKVMEQLGPSLRPVPFSITFVTADKRRDKGGEWLSIDHAVLSRNVRKKRHGKVLPKQKSSALGTQNHFANATRNVLCAKSGNTFKVHIYLIKKINGQEVAWNG